MALTPRDRMDFLALRPESDPSSLAQVRRAIRVLAVAGLGLLVGLGLIKVPAVFIAGAILVSLAVAAILRWPYVGLLLYVVIYITQIADLYPELKPLRPERLIGVMTLAALYLRQLREEGRIYIDRSPTTIWLIVLFAAVVNSVPLAWWPGKAVEGVVEFIKILVFYILVVQLIDSKTRLRTFMILYTAAMLYIALDGITNYLAGNVRVKPDGERLIGSTDVSGGPNQMAATMAASFPIFFLLAKCRAIGWWRVLYAAGTILATIVVILTNSRSGMIGFLAGMVFTWMTLRRRLVALVIGIPIVFAAWLMMPGEYQARYATLSNASEQGTAKTRYELWTKGWLMFVDHPLTGVGINCYITANPTYSERTGLDKEPYHASHSLYVQLVSNLGLPGLVAFMGFLAMFSWTLLRVIRATRRDRAWEFERVFLTGALIAVGALLVAGVFGHNLMRRQWYIFAAVGVAAARIYFHAPDAEAQREAGQQTTDRIPAPADPAARIAER